MQLRRNQRRKRRSKDKKYLCACTKNKCEGLCQKIHLFRERKNFEHCPEAYLGGEK